MEPPRVSRPPQQKRRLSAGQWTVIVILAFAAVIAVGRTMMLNQRLRSERESPATAPATRP